MNFTTSIVSDPPLKPPLSWLTMIFSPLSSTIWQYAPAFGSVTNRPTLAIAAPPSMVVSRSQQDLGDISVSLDGTADDHSERIALVWVVRTRGGVAE